MTDSRSRSPGARVRLRSPQSICRSPSLMTERRSRTLANGPRFSRPARRRPRDRRRFGLGDDPPRASRRPLERMELRRVRARGRGARKRAARPPHLSPAYAELPDRHFAPRLLRPLRRADGARWYRACASAVPGRRPVRPPGCGAPHARRVRPVRADAHLRVCTCLLPVCHDRSMARSAAASARPRANQKARRRLRGRCSAGEPAIASFAPASTAWAPALAVVTLAAWLLAWHATLLLALGFQPADFSEFLKLLSALYLAVALALVLPLHAALGRRARRWPSRSGRSSRPRPA